LTQFQWKVIFKTVNFGLRAFAVPYHQFGQARREVHSRRECSLTRLQSGEAGSSKETPHLAKRFFRREKGDQNSGLLRLINIAFSGTSFFQNLLWASIGSAVLL
jgi:hypothetical protein